MTADTSDSDSDPRLEEWQQARTTIEAVDVRLSDLRKYGLSFISALLAVQGLTEVGGPSGFVPPWIKLVIIIVTMVLIVSVALIDRLNRVTQKAAALRARVLERQLGLKLTHDITRVYAEERVNWTVEGLYLSMIVAAGALGFGVLNPTAWNWAWESYADIFATVGAGLAMGFAVPFGQKVRLVDWSLDHIRCVQGDELELWVTNLSGQHLRAADDLTLWEVEGADPSAHLFRKASDAGKVFLEVDGSKVFLHADESKVWRIPTQSLKPGVHKLFVARPPLNGTSGSEPVYLALDQELPIRLVVHKQEKPKPPPELDVKLVAE